MKPAAVERSKPSKSAAAVIMRRPKIGKANWEAAKEKEKVTEDEARDGDDARSWDGSGDGDDAQ